ncbi:MAG: glycosyltransferase family 2 protein [Solirubrobacterales bacterium]
MPGLSVVIVTFNSAADIARALPPLVAQLGEGDELVVVDNGSGDRTAEIVAGLAPAATLIRADHNEGYAAACNRGAAAASRELLLLLNPDTEVGPGFAKAICRPAAEGRWAAWMGLATRGGGELINTQGNVVHFTGFSWAGGDGRPVAEAPDRPVEVACLSGVCLAIPRTTWQRLGGFPEEFFSYHEDTDLSMRLRLEGGLLGLEPGARVEHHYAFAKPGKQKWRHLERNRWANVLRDYPGALLALVMPAMLATELALLAVSLAGGWLTAKLRANLDLLGWLPRLLTERRAIQARRKIGSREFAAGLVAELGSDYFGRAGGMAALRWGLRAYWRVVLALLGARSGSGPGDSPPGLTSVPLESVPERSS